ncbi:two-component system QseEF-associated lipoprotein QseG [Cedecea davisae]|uniref:two-component system QseEF-associated lipoprotein QseG n=1 Tax=Cedecea davisae TaxID=158484 RepID=UPI001D0A8F46|nr:two-component system QseEF-associated lipoprotein QseG [Cedecea davisae]
MIKTMKTLLLREPRRGALPRLIYWVSGMLAGAALLTGCAPAKVSNSHDEVHNAHIPEQQIPDYLSTDCSEIWELTGHDVITNPLYWLRGMDCAQRLPPAEARAEARRWPAETWQDTFKRGILLSTAKITPTERRRYMTQLDTMTHEVPLQVRSLYEIWRDGQSSLLKLSDERTRYSKLQQSTDGELDTLREQQQRLRGQLDLTTRKLENLTDIERQLSSRKPGSSLAPDTHSSDDNDDGSSATDKPQQEAKP